MQKAAPSMRVLKCQLPLVRRIDAAIRAVAMSGSYINELAESSVSTPNRDGRRVLTVTE